MINLYQIQNEHHIWCNRNFPDNNATQALLGIAEEVGELSHAHLKGIQGIRHTASEIHELKEDAVGDIVIYLLNYCNQTGLNLENVIQKTWDQVKARDWVDNPMSAGGEYSG